jgi:WD40 repeat protein
MSVVIFLYDDSLGNLHLLKRAQNERIFCVAISKDNSYIAVGTTYTNHVKLLKVKNDNLIINTTYGGHTDNVLFVTFSSTNDVISCSEDGTIRVFNKIGNKCKKMFNLSQYGIPSTVDISSDEKFLICGTWHGNIILWDFHKEEILNIFSRKAGIDAIVFSNKDNTQIICQDDDDDIFSVWDSNKCEMLYKNEEFQKEWLKSC